MIKTGDKCAVLCAVCAFSFGDKKAPSKDKRFRVIAFVQIAFALFTGHQVIDSQGPTKMKVQVLLGV